LSGQQIALHHPMLSAALNCGGFSPTIILPRCRSDPAATTHLPPLAVVRSSVIAWSRARLCTGL